MRLPLLRAPRLPTHRWHPSLPAFLVTFVTLFYGRLSVVVFVPQYAIDLGLPSEALGAYFTLLAAGTAASNLASIYLFRRLTPKRMFYLTGAFSASYEVVLLAWPTPEGVALAGLLTGFAAGGFWSLLYVLLCGLIDEHRLRANSAFAAYNAASTFIGAITPVVAGIIIVLLGYPAWILTALVVLVAGLTVVSRQTDASYLRTFNEYPLRRDFHRIAHDRRVLVAFVLLVVFSVFSLDAWGMYSNVFRVSFGIRDLWLGLLAVLTSVVITLTYVLLLRRGRRSRRRLATGGLLVVAAEMGLLVFTSDPLAIFLLEGVVAALGTACFTFATQSVLKYTFEERIYIGRPAFFAAASALDAVWLGVVGWVIASMGGYDATALVGGLTFQAVGLRLLLVVGAVVLVAWAWAWWRLERHLADDEALE